ncbi:hypothetical protein E2C01_059291 [Portunus trituberculatus]|uniref:Uncharacterized protein n=1 Tax=Portunus trituberculatus TaxID=210409 RepID=A0A5B7H251_PORTR|nr:hypothetical protein [Portunus trituberculatus]
MAPNHSSEARGPFFIIEMQHQKSRSHLDFKTVFDTRTVPRHWCRCFICDHTETPEEDLITDDPSLLQVVF